jgi:hypothetical protein
MHSAAITFTACTTTRGLGRESRLADEHALTIIEIVATRPYISTARRAGFMSLQTFSSLRSAISAGRVQD